MRHINAEFGVETGFQLSANSFVTLPYTRDKGALPPQPILGLNYYKYISMQDNENAITYNGQIGRRHF